MDTFLLLRLLGLGIVLWGSGHLAQTQLSRYFLAPASFFPKWFWGLGIYFLIFLIGFLSQASRSSILWIFDAATIVGVMLVLATYFYFYISAQMSRPRLRWKHALAILVLGVTGMAGIYSEYPADPLIHVGYVQMQPHLELGEHTSDFLAKRPTYEVRFSYFLYYWLIQSSNEMFPYAALTWVAMLMSLLFVDTFWRFTQFFTHQTWVQVLCVCASLTFLGTSLFSFQRYYILGGNYLAYVIYVEMILGLFVIAKYRCGFLLPILGLGAVFCWNNHAQELLFLLITGSGVVTFYGFQKLSNVWQKNGLLIGGLLALLSGWWVMPFSESVFIEELHLRHIDWGWHAMQWRYMFEPLGIAGVLCLLIGTCALFVSHVPIHLKALCFLPVWVWLMLSNPWTLKLFGFITDNHSVYYRFFYGSFYWVAAFVVLGHWQHLSLSSKLAQRWMVGGCFLSWMVLSIIPDYPWNGRLPHLVTQSPNTLNGQNLVSGFTFLKEHHQARLETDPTLPQKPFIFSDPYVNSFAWVSRLFDIVSIRSDSPFEKLMDASSLNDVSMSKVLQKLHRHQAQYVILYQEQQIPETLAARLSRHWNREHANTPETYLSTFQTLIRTFPQSFELLYEDPVMQIYGLQ